MADIYGSHFEYGGVSSRTHGIIIANVESQRFSQMAGTIAGVTIFSKSSKKNYLIDDDYSGSPLSFEVDIITDDERTMNLSERRPIEKWLFNRHSFRKLYLDEEDDCDNETSEVVDGEKKRLYMNCRFVNPIYLEYQGGIVGYRATLETDIGMWWQDAITKTYSIEHTSADESTTISLAVDTDLSDYTYPKMTVVMNSTGGDFTVINNTDSDSRLTKFTNVGAGATVTMNGEFNYVSSQYYELFYKQNFPRLLDGNNQITVIGNVKSITFVYNNRRHL